MKKLHGTGVALVTPFDKSRNIDLKSLKKILGHTARGVDYYVVMGTTGESSTVNLDEKRIVLDFVRANNPGKLPIVFGVGGNNTHEIVQILHEMDLRGVDAILSVSPYYSRPSQDGIINHFKAVADASPVPVIMYNVPARTSSNLTASTTLKLAEHDNIIGIKEASGNLEQCMKISKEKPKDFLLISGDDMLTVPLYSIGAVGVISVLANAFPVVFRKMKEYAMAGNFAKASAEQFRILGINGLMYEEGNPVGVKELMAQLGLCTNEVRPPHAAASVSLRAKIQPLITGLK
jgi:4-hydroxy-tetrahydrodipicolinate synthase